MSTAVPFLALVEAILDWDSEQSPEADDRTREAFAAATQAVGATGAWLELDIAVGSRLRVGSGTLRDGPSEALTPLDLTGLDRQAIRGRLWLDGAGPSQSLVRAAELALVSASERAELSGSAGRLEALDAATRAIAGVLSLDAVLQLIVDRARELLSSEYAALGIVNDLGVVERFVTSGISRRDRERIGPPPRGLGLLGLIVRENRSYRIADIGQHPASAGFPPHHPPMSSFLGVPIRVKGRSLGNFYLTNRQGAAEFSEADERLVEMFALHAGIAIENARLHEQVRQMAVVDERDRISKDLHDGVIQSIYGVSLSLEDVPQLIEEDPGAAAERVDRAIESLNGTIRDLRNFIFGLRPELADQGTLAAGLATLARELRLNTLIDAEVEMRNDGFDLDPDCRSEILQIVRESLSNVARHSRAAHVAIRVEHDDRELRLVVADDGRGFALDEIREDAHHGLANMLVRAQRLGGTLTVESSQQGTRVTILVPMMAAGAAEHEPGGIP